MMLCKVGSPTPCGCWRLTVMFFKALKRLSAPGTWNTSFAPMKPISSIWTQKRFYAGPPIPVVRLLVNYVQLDTYYLFISNFIAHTSIMRDRMQPMKKPNRPKLPKVDVLLAYNVVHPSEVVDDFCCKYIVLTLLH